MPSRTSVVRGTVCLGLLADHARWMASYDPLELLTLESSEAVRRETGKARVVAPRWLTLPPAGGRGQSS
jgi:hypothetical protein